MVESVQSDPGNPPGKDCIAYFTIDVGRIRRYMTFHSGLSQLETLLRARAILQPKPGNGPAPPQWTQIQRHIEEVVMSLVTEPYRGQGTKIDRVPDAIAKIEAVRGKLCALGVEAKELQEMVADIGRTS